MQNTLIAALVMGVFVIWLGLRLGTEFGGETITLAAIIAAPDNMLQAPFAIRFSASVIKTATIILAAYAAVVLPILTAPKKTRPGEEHGSAEWGSAGALTRAYKDKRGFVADTILTDNVHIGRHSAKNLANLNVLVIGGPGSGKSYMFVKPNLLQMSGSYIVADPKGELLRDIAPALIAKGIPFTVLNLTNKSLSDHYNPFAYLRDDADVLKLVTNLIKNTTPRDSRSSEPFWENAEKMLISAVMLYLLHEAAPEDRSFATVCDMLGDAARSEENESRMNALNLIFAELESREPNHIAVKYYSGFKQAPARTANSILSSAQVRLQAFNLPEVARITRRDDMRLGELGNKQRFIFCVIPDTDTSLNFIVGMLYTQAFQELYLSADSTNSGRLNLPVRVMMDEFANVALPDDFERILSTCRGREIYINIIIQNIAQLKALFKDGWETITGDCAALLYLGGNEQSTHEYISKLLGKSTIDTKTRGISKGRSGSSSQNFQNAGRELMLPDEVRNISKDDALVFLQSERPVRDRKYNPKRHPNYSVSALGKAEPYRRSPRIVSEQPDVKLRANSKFNFIINLED